MASNDPGVDSWTWAAMEPDPSASEKELLDRFCIEMLVDGDPVRAASRCGFQAGFAEEYGKTFYAKSYVQRRLRALREEQPADEVLEENYLRRAAIRRCYDVLTNKYSKGSDVVRASAQLDNMFGWSATARRATANTLQSGVMVIPLATMDEWEAAAQASQSKLIEESKVS
jgi:hypothetical protein